MDANFTTGIIIGFIMGVIVVKMYNSIDNPPLPQLPQVQTKTVQTYRHYDDFDGYDYDSVGLHERGF